MYLFGFKSKNIAIYDGTPLMHTKPSLYKCRKSRNHKSLNRIKLSWFIQDLLNCYWFVGSSLWHGGGWMGLWACWRCPMHACMQMHIVKHDHFNCKWHPPVGELLGNTYDIIHTCTCVCMPACMHKALPHTHPPTNLPNQKNSISLDLIEIIIFCLKIYDLWWHPQLWVVRWMGGVMSNH